MSFIEKVTNLDTSLFAGITTQTSDEDRRCLLLAQREQRAVGPYVYLEIGSHLGGTIQTHYADPLCQRIYSIDKRPLVQPDERGECYKYPENSTQTMRDNLKRAFPNADASRLITFDADASEVAIHSIDPRPDLCFIDGEHTNKALLSDFHFCFAVSKANALIATHDSGVIVNGLQEIKRELDAQHVAYVGMKLGGSVYAIALGEQANLWRERLAGVVQDEDHFVRSSLFYLRRQGREARLAHWPTLLYLYRQLTSFADWLYGRVFRTSASKN